MEFTAVEGDEKMVLEDEVFGEGAGRYKEALLCRELPLCLKLMQRDCNVEGWPETGRFEIDTWMRFSALGAYFPSYFGMTFLDSQDESVWVGHRAMQNGSASITVVEKVLIVGDKLSVREWSDECTLQAWHEYVEFIVKTLDLISACLASNVIPWDLKLDNVGVLVHGPFATRQVVIIDLDGLRPCTPQPNKGASASKIIERYVSFLRSCIESNRTILFSHGLNSMFGNWCFRLEIAFHDLHSMFDNTSDFHVFISLGLAPAYLDSIFPKEGYRGHESLFSVRQFLRMSYTKHFLLWFWIQDWHFSVDLFLQCYGSSENLFASLRFSFIRTVSKLSQGLDFHVLDSIFGNRCVRLLFIHFFCFKRQCGQSFGFDGLQMNHTPGRLWIWISWLQQS